MRSSQVHAGMKVLVYGFITSLARNHSRHKTELFFSISCWNTVVKDKRQWDKESFPCPALKIRKI